MEILQERRFIDRSTSNSQLNHASYNKLPYHDGSDWFIGYRPVCNTSYEVSLLGEAVRRAQGLAPARLQFNGEKLTRLLQVYEETCRPSKARVRMLASELQTTEKRITQWFINRRNRFKKMEENWDELSGSVQQKRKRVTQAESWNDCYKRIPSQRNDSAQVDYDPSLDYSTTKPLSHFSPLNDSSPSGQGLEEDSSRFNYSNTVPLRHFSEPEARDFVVWDPAPGVEAREENTPPSVASLSFLRTHPELRYVSTNELLQAKSEETRKADTLSTTPQQNAKVDYISRRDGLSHGADVNNETLPSIGAPEKQIKQSYTDNTNVLSLREHSPTNNTNNLSHREHSHSNNTNELSHREHGHTSNTNELSQSRDYYDFIRNFLSDAGLYKRELSSITISIDG